LFLATLKLEINFAMSIKEFKKLGAEYIDFLKYSLFSGSLSFLATTSPNLLLNRFFSSTTTGYYSLSEKVLGSPIWFITSSVSDVFKQEFSEQQRIGKDSVLLFKKTVKTLLLIGFIPFVAIFILSPFVIPPLFGSEWSSVAEYIRIFTIMYYSYFVINPLKSVVYILNKQKLMIVLEFLRFLAIIIAFFIGYIFKSISLTLFFWSGLVTLVNILTFFVIYKLVLRNRHERQLTLNS